MAGVFVVISRLQIFPRERDRLLTGQDVMGGSRAWRATQLTRRKGYVGAVMDNATTKARVDRVKGPRGL